MSITVSPLDLVLDTENPRFVIVTTRQQSDIRKYLVTYEDVCQLAAAINEYGSLLPGERIVVLQENDKYIVVEGNRRTCSLQFLLARELIPDGFDHLIPPTSASVIEKCSNIEVDVLPDRNAALELMTKRHIEGVKQWKPLAKKQFFAANYNDGNGQSIRNLSQITGIKESDIRNDIRDYKFFFSVYTKYAANHPDFNRDIIVLKTDPFWRIFKAKFDYPVGQTNSPKDFFQITYDNKQNAVSNLPTALFEQITQLVFEQAIVQETITTRNTIADVDRILPLLEAVVAFRNSERPDRSTPDAEDDTGTTAPEEPQVAPAQTPPGNFQDDGNINPHTDEAAGGPRPGGPAPRSFFETINWHGKLIPSNQSHQGLLHAINELYLLSTKNCGQQKAYCVLPIATGMILRTVYEQALRLRLQQVSLWGSYLQAQNQNSLFPTLHTMEQFINTEANISRVFPFPEMRQAFSQVVQAAHRDFLNANIHNPGNIRVTADSLEAIAARGMFFVIQGIINSL